MKTLPIGILLSVCISLGAIGADRPTPAGPLVGALAGIDTASPWRIHRSEHFLVAFGRDPGRAAIQAQLLEATYRRFFDAFEGFDAAPVADPMVCLFFESKEDYLRYARRADHVDMAWTVAYYSAKTNRIAFYRNAPLHRRADADAAAADADENQLYGSPRSARTSDPRDAAPVAAAEASGPVRGRGVADLLRRHPVSLASATHEAAHQLAFNSGLQRRGVLYPLWVSEGLATNFELVGPERAFGPDQANPARRQRLERLFNSRCLIPLDRFITLTEPPTGNAGATDAIYAQAWGLFQFLYLEHRAALALYLGDLYGLPAGPRDAPALHREFTRRFGDLGELESQWRQWLADADRAEP